MSKKKKHIGKIYYVDPIHLVKPKRWSQYVRAKGPSALNKRPVAVTIQRSKRNVQVSELTSQATDKQVLKHQRVRLENTYPNKKSYINTETISRSRKTKKKFRVGELPLKNAVSKKIEAKDLQRFKHARKKRGWKK